MKLVKAVVQIIGHSNVPATPKHIDDLTEWYRKVGLLCSINFTSLLMGLTEFLCCTSIYAQRVDTRTQTKRPQEARRTDSHRCVFWLTAIRSILSEILDESQVVKLIHRALPGIAEFINQQLGKEPKSS